MRSILPAVALCALLAGCIQITVGSPTTTAPAPTTSAAPATIQSAPVTPLSVDFDWNPSQPQANDVVHFQSHVTGLGNRTIDTWLWIWDDGSKDGSGYAPTHSWTKARLDEYNVTLRAMASDGSIVERTHGVFVTARSGSASA